MKDEAGGFGFTKKDFENHRKSLKTIQNDRILPEGVSLFDALMEVKNDDTMNLVYKVLEEQ